MALSERPILIKKVKKVSGGGHHGGAWKVAYADFVTAMMAFFLLMWLINTVSPEQKRGIADYFAPASVAETTSGSGGLLGGTALGEDGGKASGSMSIVEHSAPEVKDPSEQKAQNSAKGSAEEAAQKAMQEASAKREEAAFASAAESIRQALQDMPELAELSKNIIVDQTPEGLRIQLVDQEGRSLFGQGSAAPNDRAKVLLRAMAKIINNLPNRISISGHTAVSLNGSTADTDWNLSSARADASRKILQSSGVAQDRIYQVSGKATSEPLYIDDPTLPGNRRIAIVLLREAPVLPPDTGM